MTGSSALAALPILLLAAAVLAIARLIRRRP